jgi:hypothetical protein
MTDLKKDYATIKPEDVGNAEILGDEIWVRKYPPKETVGESGIILSGGSELAQQEGYGWVVKTKEGDDIYSEGDTVLFDPLHFVPLQALGDEFGHISRDCVSAIIKKEGE